MKPLGVISTAVLFLLLGISLPAFAEEGQEEKGGGGGKAQEAQHEQQPQHAQQKQQKQEQHAQKAQQKEQKQANQQAKQEQRGQKQEQHAQKAQQKEQKQSAQQTQRAQKQSQGGQDAKSSQQSGRYSGRGGHIPDDRFRAHFGREHMFHLDRTYIVAGGYSRFQYGGYWFGMYDPWPFDWYYTDDIYVDYLDGGYYLYSPMHPGIRISIGVVL